MEGYAHNCECNIGELINIFSVHLKCVAQDVKFNICQRPFVKFSILNTSNFFNMYFFLIITV